MDHILPRWVASTIEPNRQRVVVSHVQQVNFPSPRVPRRMETSVYPSPGIHVSLRAAASSCVIGHNEMKNNERDQVKSYIALSQGRRTRHKSTNHNAVRETFRKLSTQRRLGARCETHSSNSSFNVESFEGSRRNQVHQRLVRVCRIISYISFINT